LGSVLGRLVAWVTWSVCRMMVRILYIHIPILGQMTMIPSSSSLGCKFCHSFPFCVANYSGWIYYVVHRFQSMSRAMIHLGVHNHLIADGKCWEFVEEIRRLIIEEVDPTPNTNISSISLSVSKTLASYLFDGSNNGIVELFKDEQLKHIQDKFDDLNSPYVHNLTSFKCHSRGGLYW